MFISVFLSSDVSFAVSSLQNVSQNVFSLLLSIENFRALYAVCPSIGSLYRNEKLVYVSLIFCMLMILAIISVKKILNKKKSIIKFFVFMLFFINI